MERSTGKAGLTIGKLIGAAGGLFALKKGFDMVKSSIDGAISRYDTLNNFPRVLEQMGFSADESQKAINELSDGIQGLPTTLDDVAGTAQRIAILTNNLEGATDTTLALNNAFISSGSDSANASRGLEQYVQMLSKGEVDLQSWRTLQETMGVALNDTAKAFGFAGASAQNDLYDALKDGSITFDDFNEKIIELNNETGGFADRALTASGGIRTSWTNMKTAIVRGTTNIIDAVDDWLKDTSLESIENIISNVGDKFFGVLDGIAQGIPTAVDKIKEFKENLDPWIPLIKQIITAIGGFVIAFSVFNTLKNVVMGVRGAILVLNAAMLANPIGLIIGIIGGLIAIIVYLWNTNDEFKEFMINAWNMIKDVAMQVWQSISDFIMPIVDEIVNFVMEIWSILVEFWNEHGQMILEAVMNVWNAIWSVIETVMNVIWGIMQFLWPSIQAIIENVWNVIQGVVKGAIDVVLGIIQFFAALFTGNWSGMWDAVKKILSGALEIVKSVIKGVFNNIKIIISTILDAIKAIISAIWNGIKNTISTVLNIIKNVISNIWNGIKNTVSNVVNGIKDTVSNVFNSLKSVVSGAFNKVKTAVSDGIGKSLDVVTNIKDKFKDAGKNIVGSIADGIKGAVSKVTDAIGNVTKKIRDFLPFSPAKDGALTDIMDIQLVQSIAEAIQKGERYAVAAMSKVSEAIHGEMPVVDVAGQVASINSQANRQMQSHLTSELNVNKQPIVIHNVTTLDGRIIAEETYEHTDELIGGETALDERWGR